MDRLYAKLARQSALLAFDNGEITHDGLKSTLSKITNLYRKRNSIYAFDPELEKFYKYYKELKQKEKLKDTVVAEILGIDISVLKNRKKKCEKRGWLKGTGRNSHAKIKFYR